jgi:hypothetical protein
MFRFRNQIKKLAEEGTFELEANGALPAKHAA